MKKKLLNTTFLICLYRRSALRGIILLALLCTVLLPGCRLTPGEIPSDSDGTKSQQTSSREQSNSQQNMTLKISPQELPDYRPYRMSQPINLLTWGTLSVQAPQTSSVTLTTGSSTSQTSNSQSFIQTAWEAAQDVPATVWTYGFIGVAIGIVVAVVLSGYRIIGVCISGASVLAMVAIALVYSHGEIIAYAVAGVIGFGGLLAAIALFVYIYKGRGTAASFHEVVSGCNQFLKSNTDSTAADLFKKSQLSAQSAKTRERVKKA